jgi:hypothetical protein
MKFRRYYHYLVPLAILLFQATTATLTPAATPEPGAPSADTTIYLPLTVRGTSIPRATNTPPPPPTDTPTPPPHSNAIVIDHNSIALFDQIPSNYLTAARNLRQMYSDRSVGADINSYLSCFAATGWTNSSNSCRADYINEWDWKTFTQSDLDQGAVPDSILFSPDPTVYSRSNWTFEPRQGTWSDLTQNFIQELAPSYLNSKDVLSYQFSYVNVGDNSDIADPDNGFFANNANKYDVYDLEAFIAQHPDKTFFYWTTSLARGIGNEVSTDFNNQMRQYALTNDKILFDVADILSHTPTGEPCYDNRDSVEYCSMVGDCENFPDDGVNYPAICQEYTTETIGGHLGSVSAGGLQITRAYWVLMARIAGWNP